MMIYFKQFNNILCFIIEVQQSQHAKISELKCNLTITNEVHKAASEGNLRSIAVAKRLATMASTLGRNSKNTLGVAPSEKIGKLDKNLIYKLLFYVIKNNG